MGWARRTGRGYQALYRDPAGRIRSAGVFRLKSQARAAADDQEAAIRADRWVDPDRGQEPFEDYVDRWLTSKNHLAPKTVQDYQTTLNNHVRPYFAEVPMRALSRELIEDWLGELRGSRGPATIRKAWRALGMILNDAEAREVIVRNPMRGIKLNCPNPKRAPAFLSPSELLGLAQTMEDRDRALVLTAGLLGLRWGECVALTVADLDLDAQVLTVSRTISEVSGHLYEKDTKNHLVRRIDLPGWYCDQLREHIARHVGADGRLFTAPEGGVLRRNWYRRSFKPAVARAGLPSDITFHALRHTAASVAASPLYGAAGSAVVQELLGHQTRAMTEDIYAHLFSGERLRLRDALDRVYREAAAQVLRKPDPTLSLLPVGEARNRG